MSFFVNTDSGITLNRFSQDLMLIDMELPIAALNTFASRFAFLPCFRPFLDQSNTLQRLSSASPKWPLSAWALSTPQSRSL